MALHTNPGEPKRILKACGNCRRRKVKCDSNSPCGTCFSSDFDCEREQGKSELQTHGQVALPGFGSTSSMASSDDGRIVDLWGFSAVDLQIDTFGASSGGWCPSRIFRRH